MASRVLALVEHPANETLPLEDDERSDPAPRVPAPDVPDQLPLADGVHPG